MCIFRLDSAKSRNQHVCSLCVADQERKSWSQARAFNRLNVAGDGDLSTVRKALYGTRNKFSPIIESQKPMLSPTNPIYPGQVLRIPPA